MPNIPCSNPCVTCTPGIAGGSLVQGVGPVDPANPYVNLSSEVADVDTFIGRRYSVGDPPVGGGIWFASGCLGFCVSSESQQEADLCAQQQAVLCLSPNWPTYVPNPGNPDYPFIPEPTQTFTNAAQSCNFTCPDGSEFTFTVAAGIFSAFSQEAANLMAYSFACNQAVNNRVCIGSLSPTTICAGQPYSGSVTTTSARTPLTFTIVGSLPDGLVLSQNTTTAFITGTPTTPGSYVFTVVATDPIGQSMSKLVELKVFGITNPSPLPSGVVGTAYSQSMFYSGSSTSSVTWSVIAGSLPDGLTLNPTTGEITGTPTTDGTSVFTLAVTEAGMTCSKNFSMEVTAESSCGFPITFTWENITGPVLQGDGSLIVSNVNGDLSGSGGAGPYVDPGFPNDANYSADMILDRVLTTLSSDFTIPGVGLTDIANVADSSVFEIGQTVFATDGADAGHFEVISLPGPTQVELEFLDEPGDSLPGAIIASTSEVSEADDIDVHLRGTYISTGNQNAGFGIDLWDGDPSGGGVLISSTYISGNTFASPYDEIITIGSMVNGFATLRFTVSIVGCIDGGGCSGQSTSFDFTAELGC